jgi:hypothetical protein
VKPDLGVGGRARDTEMWSVAASLNMYSVISQSHYSSLLTALGRWHLSSHHSAQLAATPKLVLQLEHGYLRSQVSTASPLP